jgi:hypothetical protein
MSENNKRKSPVSSDRLNDSDSNNLLKFNVMGKFKVSKEHLIEIVSAA